MTARRPAVVLPAALLLLAVALAAQFVAHPHTPYKLFLLRIFPAMALWLLVVIAARRWRPVMIFSGGLGIGFVAGWGLLQAPAFLPPLAPGWTAPAMIGVWLAILLLLAACTGRLNRYFRHGPMTAVGVAAVVYALASGVTPLPLGAELMTAGALWIAIWQAVYLYKAPDPAGLAQGA